MIKYKTVQAWISLDFKLQEIHWHVFPHTIQFTDIVILDFLIIVDVPGCTVAYFLHSNPAQIWHWQ